MPLFSSVAVQTEAHAETTTKQRKKYRIFYTTAAKYYAQNG